MRYNFIITFQNQILKIQLNFSMAHFIKPFLPICLSIHLKVFLPGLEWKTINSGKILLQGVCLDRVWVQIRSHSMTSLSTQTFYQSSLFGFQKQSKRNHFILRLSKSCQCQIVPKPTQNFFSRNWQGDVGVGVVVHGNGAELLVLVLLRLLCQICLRFSTAIGQLMPK